VTIYIPRQLAAEAREKAHILVKKRDLTVNTDYMDGLVNAQHYTAWICPKASVVTLDMIIREATKWKQTKKP
jgi:hypothetical protein